MNFQNLRLSPSAISTPHLYSFVPLFLWVVTFSLALSFSLISLPVFTFSDGSESGPNYAVSRKSAFDLRVFEIFGESCIQF